ncbi:hypothetical protein Ancab_029342 [Ancistrocladus abbreviatus]
MKLKKKDLVRGAISIGHNNKAANPTAFVGKKVLPISESTFSSSTDNSYDQCEQKKDQLTKSDSKAKAMSRMKELLRWAAGAIKKQESALDKRSNIGPKRIERKTFSGFALEEARK